MSFKNPVQSLRDIVDAITSIVEFTSGMDFVGFQSDAKTVAAVERKLLVISEAAIRLGDQGPALCPDQPWPTIHGTDTRNGQLDQTSVRADQSRRYLAHRD